MKKTLCFYTRVFVDVDMLSSLSYQLLVEHPEFAFGLMKSMNNFLLFALFVQ